MSKPLVSLVTGAASGLGRATAQRLSSKFGPVLILDLPASSGQAVAEEMGNDVTFVPCDVAEEKDVQNAMEICLSKHGRLDVSVNCAGMSRAFKIANPRKDACSQATFLSEVLHPGLFGTFNVCRLSAQLMAKNTPSESGERGVIINTTGQYSYDGAQGQSSLAATKGAIAALNMPMSRDLADLGIRVNSINPGYFDTPLMSELSLTPTIKKFLQETMAFPRRFGSPDEFADMVVHIIENQYINGSDVRLTAATRTFTDLTKLAK